MLSSTHATRETLHHVWPLLVRSLKWPCIGKWPSEDANGRPRQPGEPGYNVAGRELAGGFYACVYVLRGDLD
eukprot:947759-Alexandrium_andersonii.AAC.1